MSNVVIGEVNATTCTCTAQYQWVIDNFWICCKDNGDALRSPEFLMSHTVDPTIVGRIFFYPKGVIKEAEEYLSLFIKIKIGNADIITEVKLSISNNELELATGLFQKPILDRNETVWGATKFVNRNFIKNKVNNPRRCDKLTIVVEIKTRNNKKQMKVIQGKLTNQILQELSDDYEQLVDNEEYSDFELIIGNKSLRAHKNILSQRSPVFAAMFKSEMKENKENKVEISDVRYEVCLEMIRYIYATTVSDIENIADELLAAADKYCLKDLKRMCEESSSENVNADNVVEKLRIAYLHSAEMLKVTTIGFIAAHGADIVKKPEFRQLPADAICDVLSAVFDATL